MLNLGLAGITGLAAALLTPVVWLVLWLAGAVSALALAADMRLWRLHLAGLFGLVVAWGVPRLVQGFAEQVSMPWMLASGYSGAVLSSMIFFPLVASFLVGVVQSVNRSCFQQFLLPFPNRRDQSVAALVPVWTAQSEPTVGNCKECQDEH